MSSAFYCDCCGKVFKVSVPATLALNDKLLKEKIKGKHTLDLCHDCAEGFMEFLKTKAAK